MRVSGNLMGPDFLVDPGSANRDTGRQIDWSRVDDSYRTTAYKITVTGPVAADGVTIPVAALPQTVSVGETLYFGPTKKFAEVSVTAQKGATSLTVLPIPTALVAGDVAVVAGSGPKKLLAGTVVGFQAEGRKISPRVAGTNPAAGLLETDATEFADYDAKTGYGFIIGAVVYENMLPDARANNGTLLQAVKDELAARGTGWAFRTYENNAATN